MSDPFADEQDDLDMSINPSKATKSNICALLIGDEDSLKSGISMDCRSKAQIDAGEKVYYIDVDDASHAIWSEHWNEDENIVVKNPTLFVTEEDKEGNKKKVIDYERTLQRIHTFVTNVDDAIKSGEVTVAGFVFDGVDTLLTDSEATMRDAIGLDVDDGVNFKYWSRRNMYFNEVIKAIKALPCPKYFITHKKDWKKTKKDRNGAEVVVKEWVDGDFEKKLPHKMWQIIDCACDVSGDTSTYTAKIREFKGRPELKGKTYTTMIIEHGDNGVVVNYYGLGVLRDAKNVEDRELDALF